ncbi:DegT/DnrJ/EryC1/StrS family aminotransferase [Paenibacillus cymbidii]|uniref:DegT/DnrJ/EryC1/StrS family aminotransferase n=1 Tax=Paenibacillus cymbidii TaxID=1639034 RepID=UPI001080D5D6|nr:DegT/DnrJ/EryC1/StrS family aminotransferase [Paenibacillus cymbidii]
MQVDKLALLGGEPVKTTPYGTGKRFGEEELKELAEALEQNTLFYHSGNKVKRFLREFNELYGAPYSVATSSGTAAIHVALGAAGVTVGDEVITSPITDQGTIIGILFQNAIPVFADLEPDTYNMDPRSIEARITERTKAIVVVHLAGNPADMEAIMAIARKRGVKVIEDCAQSYLAPYRGRYVGAWGDYGCFSTNDFKHMSTGDGGLVLVNSGDEADYRKTHSFADKNYQRLDSAVTRDIEGLAPNYRMTELQGAVGIAQLRKLPWICRTRQQYGDRITAGIAGLPGIVPRRVVEGAESSYWFYMLRLEEEKLGCTREQFSAALTAEGITNSGGYLLRPIYGSAMFQRRTAYAGSHFPFDLTGATYPPGLCPEAERILQTCVTMPLNEFYTEQDIDDIIAGIRKVALYYGRP